MKTTLHYQVKDFQRFVLENLEKRGYTLAAGTEPMMADMDNLEDPEQVVMQVLVEERLEAVFNQLEFQKILTAELPAPTIDPEVEPDQKVKKEKAPRTVTEKEAARRAAASDRMKGLNSAKVSGDTKPETEKRPGPNDKTALAERQIMRQQVVAQRIAQVEPEPTAVPEPARVMQTDHTHDITVYQVKGFIDPASEFHKHHIRMCKSCGYQENIKCLICAEKQPVEINEAREVVTPALAVFPTSTAPISSSSRETQPALTR